MFDSRDVRRADPSSGRPGGADFGLLVDELRTYPTDRLVRERDAVLREQRRLRVRELALTRVLDERGAIDDTVAARDGVSIRALRDTVATARALEQLPSIASVAAAGALSDAQLTEVVRVADAASDAEWAERAPGYAPADLAQIARTKAAPTPEEGRARRAAREVRFGWDRRAGMLTGRFALPDLDGSLFENVINRMAERMRPPKGQPWETWPRRAADALVELCRSYADDRAVTGPAPLLVVHVPQSGPATVAGVPLPDTMVEALRTQARLEPVLIDGDAAPVAVGRVGSALPGRITAAVLRRDARCRVPGCDVRHGLRVQQLLPGSWAGSDDLANLAAVCTTGADHASRLAPTGEHLLLGNPNRPDGLHLVHRDDLPRMIEVAVAAGARSANGGRSAGAGVGRSTDGGSPGGRGARGGRARASARRDPRVPEARAGPARRLL